MNLWHQAAAQADFKTYFKLMSENAVFIGSDATENWTKPKFEAYAKPHFDKGKAWTFTCLERTIFISTDGNTAWFDELLDTSYKICRGSGVLIRTEKGCKIAQYVLSLTIPNDVAKEVVTLKDSTKSILIPQLKCSSTK
ncbi:MAG: nuclear transport factor 2 family protein [Flavobacterium sp.]